ncbi:MAG: hypothetical protein JOZ55_09330 [Alphaproteobacteria bacterium]|nr:hypothetical protein [Alphaproteobacteria bacterium]
MLHTRIPTLRLSRLGKRSQYLISETLVLAFGLATCQVFQTSAGHVHWNALFPCFLGYLAAFALLLTTRCDNCNEPVGREGKRLVAFPHSHCERCGADLR